MARAAHRGVTVLAADGPSPLWYATRGAGLTTLVLLTGTVVLGIATAARWEGPGAPRFVTATMHRNLGLATVVLLTVHVVTTLLDPYAAITVRDATIPMGAAYRPLWLGVGVLAAEILLVVTVTSALRSRLGPRAWRVIHWTAYASWPLAVVHGLGTGSDAQQPWTLGLTVSCIAAVVMSTWRRLGRGRLVTLPARMLAGATAFASLGAVLVWSVQGPLQPGWSARAGTPAAKTATAAARPRSSTAAIHDALIGSMVSAAGTTEVALRDVAEPGLTLAVRSPGRTETLPVVSVLRDGRTLCTTAASAGTSLYAVCGRTRLIISLFRESDRLTGTLVTSGPLQ